MSLHEESPTQGRRPRGGRRGACRSRGPPALATATSWGTGRGQRLPQSLQRLWSQTSGLLSCERVGFCCSKPPNSGRDSWDRVGQHQDPAAGGRRPAPHIGVERSQTGGPPRKGDCWLWSHSAGRPLGPIRRPGRGSWGRPREVGSPCVPGSGYPLHMALGPDGARRGQRCFSGSPPAPATHLHPHTHRGHVVRWPRARGLALETPSTV